MAIEEYEATKKAATLGPQTKDPFRNFVAHGKQKEFLLSNKGMVGMIGANRSGKTEVIAFAGAAIARREHPTISCPEGGGIIWLVSLTEKLLKNVSWKKMRHYIPEYMIADKTERPGLYWLKMKNGVEIFGMYCAAGADKFQGEACDAILFDEEPDESVYKECLARLVDRDGVMLFSMTPVKGSPWFYRQIYTSRDPDIHIIKVGMRDNPYMKERNIRKLEQRFLAKGASEDEIKVRVDGKYILWGGLSVFDPRHIEHLLETGEPDTDMRGVYTDDGGWIDMPNGIIKVWERPNPKHTYVIGADAAQGIQSGDADAGGDFSAAFVYNMNTKKQVAQIHCRIDTDLFAHNLRMLGVWYGDALIAVEAEKFGVAVLKELVFWHYPQVYMQRPRGKRYDAQTKMLGWMPDAKNKSEAVKNMRRSLRDGEHGIVSHNLVDEIITYVYNTGGKMGAEVGSHDDLVASCYIALSVARETLTRKPPVKQYPRGTAGYELREAMRGRG